MKTPTAFLLLTLSLVVGGCIDTKDVGVESDASSGGSAAEGSAGSMTSGASESASSSASGTGAVPTAGTETATASGTATSESGGETGVETMATATASDSDTDTFGGSESTSGSDTGGGDDQTLCEDSGGIWDPSSCGHYTCGLGPDCGAVVPGCDCGLGSVFIEGAGGGCVQDEECGAVVFGCGGPDAVFSAPSMYCRTTIPGVKGGEPSHQAVTTPASCSDAYTCACLEEAGDCEKDEFGVLRVTIAAP